MILCWYLLVLFVCVSFCHVKHRCALFEKTCQFSLTWIFLPFQTLGDYCSPSTRMSVTIREGDEFNSYDDFQDKLKLYSKDHNVQFSLADSKTIKTANAKLSTKATPFKEELKYRYAKFRCKHGGEKRTTGCGIRPVQR